MLNYFKLFCILGVLSSISGCESEENLNESQVYGRWEWVKTYQRSMGRPYTVTPEEAGYDLFMIIGHSDTIQHFRNDTLSALSLIRTREFYSDRIEMYHEFIDSVDWGNGFEPVVLWGEEIIYQKDTLWSATPNDIADFFASTVYCRTP